MKLNRLKYIGGWIHSRTTAWRSEGQIAWLFVACTLIAIYFIELRLYISYQEALDSLEQWVQDLPSGYVSAQVYRHLETLINSGILVFYFACVFMVVIVLFAMKMVSHLTNTSISRLADEVAASIDGIFLLEEGGIIYLNPTAKNILGIDAAGSLSRLNPDLIKNADGLRAVMAASRSPIPVEFALNIGERKVFYLLQSFSINRDLIQKMEHSIGKRIESLLVRFHADTLVLAQDVTVIRESQDAKNHFLATLSHEVKTPVTSLTMATRLLRRSLGEISNPMLKNLILTCADDVDRLRSLLDDLMTVSRFDSFVQDLEIQRVDLGKLFLHSVQSFQRQAKERGIRLLSEIIRNGRSVVVSVDATKITWAISNLLVNALRHTPRGGVVTAKVEAHLDRIEVKVKDTGPGIERSRQERIFEKFNSYYDLRIARSGSVGAGLAIAREIVKAHGGRIWVESDLGCGAEFCFTIPIKDFRPIAQPSAHEESKDWSSETGGEHGYMKGVSSGANSGGR